VAQTRHGAGGAAATTTVAGLPTFFEQHRSNGARRSVADALGKEIAFARIG
jgi:hypothetical protein